jgi:N6-adenosine-specific RNA methylase IME4
VSKELAPNLSKLALQINEAHRRFEQSMRGSLELAVEAGEKLSAVRQSLPHGQWLPWLKQHFSGSVRHAQNYMAMFSRRAEIESNTQRASHLSLRSAVKLLTKSKNGQTRATTPKPEPQTEPETVSEPDVPDDLIDGEVVSIVDSAPLAALAAAEAAQASIADPEFHEAEPLEQMAAAGKKFGTIYADPPWRYGNQATRASTDNHYETMSVEEIAELPVAELADEKCHLWLWTTNAFLFECPKLFDAWGFEFKSSYVWVKSQMGIGNYLRNAHEFLLLAVKGGLTGAARDVRSWGEFPRGSHSAKPERVRSHVIERVSPGPRLELFGRAKIDGWTVWGNQIRKGIFDVSDV